MKISVVVFPGSNCDHDVVHIYERVLGQVVNQIWHTETDLKAPDLVVLPGGFAHGDYLRTGAMAKTSPIMAAVREFAERGGPVLGICNGFQILCEAQLLPGVLLRNVGMRFLSQFVHLKVERTSTPFTNAYSMGEVMTCPIAHFEGNYFAEPDTLKELEENSQIVFRYSGQDGQVSALSALTNPNGSCHAIAGICNRAGNVVGLMPHPDRAYEALVGSIGKDTGLKFFSGVMN